MRAELRFPLKRMLFQSPSSGYLLQQSYHVTDDPLELVYISFTKVMWCIFTHNNTALCLLFEFAVVLTYMLRTGGFAGIGETATQPQLAAHSFRSD